MNTLLLLASVFAVAAPDQDISRLGGQGLLAYVIVSLGTSWIEAYRNAGHREDCAIKLAAIEAKFNALVEGAATPLPPRGRQPSP